MSNHGPITVKAMVVCVFVALIGGVLLGIFIQTLRFATSGQRLEVHKLSPELQSMAMQWLSEYKQNKIIRNRRIRLFDSHFIDVGIVADTEPNVERGFAKVNERFRHFIVSKEGLEINEIEGRYLFVTLRRREIQDLEQ